MTLVGQRRHRFLGLAHTQITSEIRIRRRWFVGKPGFRLMAPSHAFGNLHLRVGNDGVDDPSVRLTKTTTTTHTMHYCLAHSLGGTITFGDTKQPRAACIASTITLAANLAYIRACLSLYVCQRMPENIGKWHAFMRYGDMK